jgi:hypothetical protein
MFFICRIPEVTRISIPYRLIYCNLLRNMPLTVPRVGLRLIYCNLIRNMPLTVPRVGLRLIYCNLLRNMPLTVPRVGLRLIYCNLLRNMPLTVPRVGLMLHTRLAGRGSLHPPRLLCWCIFPLSASHSRSANG